MIHITTDDIVQVIETQHFLSISDIIGYLTISRTTFYKHWKVGSKDYETITNALWHNRREVVRSSIEKLKRSDNIAAVIALIKLAGDDNERRALLDKSYIEKELPKKNKKPSEVVSELAQSC